MEFHAVQFLPYIYGVFGREFTGSPGSLISGTYLVVNMYRVATKNNIPNDRYIIAMLWQVQLHCITLYITHNALQGCDQCHSDRRLPTPNITILGFVPDYIVSSSSQTGLRKKIDITYFFSMPEPP